MAGEGSVGQILGGGRGTHGEGGFRATFGFELGEHVAHGGFEGGREGLRHDQFADLASGGDQRVDVVDVERGKQLADARVEAFMSEEFAVGVGGGREAVGNAYAKFAQVADHFAQRGILAAYLADVVHPHLVEPEDVLSTHYHLLVNKTGPSTIH